MQEHWRLAAAAAAEVVRVVAAHRDSSPAVAGSHVGSPAAAQACPGASSADTMREKTRAEGAACRKEASAAALQLTA